jgi:hypothetical protein
VIVFRFFLLPAEYYLYSDILIGLSYLAQNFSAVYCFSTGEFDECPFRPEKRARDQEAATDPHAG